MAQDIIYNSSGGKKSMPKHAALAMTVRHLTGSAKLIGLLNGFGHASSHSVVLEHDTALAQKQLDMGPINLPPFIKQREFTTLIWDNNDFGEETLSGSGTTHNTNGIVVQTQQADHSPEDAFCCPPVAYKKTKSRSLEPPPTELASYYGGAKKGPSVFGAAIPIHETTDGQVNAMTLDTSYVLSRAIQRESNQHRPPSWTGFNTLIADNIPAKSIIGYLPVIDASPTEMDTIETILCRSLEIANALHLQTIVTVFDQAIYAKAQQIRWKSEYIATLPTDEALEVHNILASLSDSFPTNFPDRLSDEKLQSLLQSYQEFVSKAATNPMLAFWSSYIDMVQVLLLFIRASRESNWDLHLSSIRSMMPWFMAYDRVNYARYAPVYWLEMKEFSTKHPSVEEEFQRGHFSVQRQTSHGFAGIPCGQTIEQTANRDSKTKGGLTGITVNKGAVHRWISSHHMRAEISRECEEMAGKESMVDPFDQNQLVNLTSGVVASKEVADDLASAKSKGEVAVQSFITDRLQGEETGFFAPIKRLNLKTFASMRRKRTTKVKGKVIELKSNRNLFARLLLCGTSRNISLESMLQYCLGPLPLSLSTHDGTLVKHPKAKLMHHLESCTQDPYLSSIPQDCTWIVDAMAMLQQLKVSTLPATFGEL
ncbi:hypothetical protein BSL78_21395 [Apostichopus japonicus]|uniref:Uncharacterized protein n=1 Tax=Stichopus japonicus TaxID=307972 RepID=A0A2G8K184_STIJA|nr:hypothetical protein BSL78_21395 [Apostichopus japonicus]